MLWDCDRPIKPKTIVKIAHIAGTSSWAFKAKCTIFQDLPIVCSELSCHRIKINAVQY